MTASELHAQSPPKAPIASRILGALAGVLLLLTSAGFTIGTSLAAPIGPAIARRVARRKGGSLSWGTAWLSAVFASGVALALVSSIIFTRPASRPVRQARRSATTAATPQAMAQPPEWVRYFFPQAAQQPGPLTQRLIRSRAFTVYVTWMGAAMAVAFFGAIAGSLGWGAVLLLRYAASGRFAP